MNLLEQNERQLEIIGSIRKQFSDVAFPNVRRENLYYGMPKKENYLDGFQALLGDENRVFSFVSDAYTLVRNEVVANKVLTALENFKQKPKVSFQFPNSGSRMRMTVDFESEFKKLNKVGDKISPSIRVKNSYDKQWIMSIAYGAKELVCANGLTVFKLENGTKKKHMGTNINVEMLMQDENDLFTDEITKFLDGFNQQLEYYKQWDSLRIDSGKYQEEVKPKMPFTKTEHEKLEEMPIIGRKFTVNDLLKNNGLTLWELNRSATQFCTHELKDNPTKAITYEEVIAKTMDSLYSELTQ
jgi:hypothetical protein